MDFGRCAIGNLDRNNAETNILTSHDGTSPKVVFSPLLSSTADEVAVVVKCETQTKSDG